MQDKEKKIEDDKKAKANTGNLVNENYTRDSFKEEDNLSPFYPEPENNDQTWLDKVIYNGIKRSDSMRASRLSENWDKSEKITIGPETTKTNVFRRKSFFQNKEKNPEAGFDFYETLINGNQKWIENCKKKDENYFVKLAKPQHPKCLVISCSDSRVVVNDCLGLEPGELFSHRNVGNLVISTDFNVQSVIQFAVEVLKVEHLIVVGHTDCGAVKASLTSNYHGLIDHWLRTIRETAENTAKKWKK